MDAPADDGHEECPCTLAPERDLVGLARPDAGCAGWHDPAVAIGRASRRRRQRPALDARCYPRIEAMQRVVMGDLLLRLPLRERGQPEIIPPRRLVMVVQAKLLSPDQR